MTQSGHCIAARSSREILVSGSDVSFFATRAISSSGARAAPIYIAHSSSGCRAMDTLALVQMVGVAGRLPPNWEKQVSEAIDDLVKHIYIHQWFHQPHTGIVVLIMIVVVVLWMFSKK